jgi:hypothetical protein
MDEPSGPVSKASAAAAIEAVISHLRKADGVVVLKTVVARRQQPMPM